MRTVLVLLFSAGWVGGASIAERVAAVAASSPVAGRGHWGVHAVRLETKETVYARNEGSFFTPASTTKLFSSALALSKLGAAHRFVTRLVEAGGHLYLVGGGDPTLSGRAIPYDRDAPMAAPLGPLEAMVEEAWSKGLREVAGDVVGDDTRYVWEPYPVGWAVDDTIEDYGAPVSALVLHENAVTVRVRAGAAAGDAGLVTVVPDTGYFGVESQVATQRTGGRVQLRREVGSRVFSVWGALAVKGATAFPVAVDDPALYSAHVLRRLLLRRGVTVGGNAVARHYLASDAAPPVGIEGVEWARRVSPPLEEVLRVVNKISHNLMAEIVLREAARVHAPEASRRGGLDLLRTFLGGMGVAAADHRIEDGSGLSRLNVVTPRALTRLLEAMDRTAHGEVWQGLLPASAQDGSLAARFREWTPGRVRAKTGGMTHVTSLAGYGEAAGGGTVAFAVMVNNSNVAGSESRAFIDKIVKAILE